MSSSFLGHLNYLAIFVSMLVFVSIGRIWYSRYVFGKAWARAMKLDASVANSTSVTWAYTVNILCSLAAAFALAVVIHLFGVSSARGAVMTGLLTSIGFVASSVISSAIFAQKPASTVTLNVIYQVIGYIIM